MKKMSKFLVALTMIFSISFVLASCNDSDTPTVPETPVNTSYSVSVGSLNGGSVAVDVDSAKAGDTVNVTVKPNFGYKLKEGSLKANSVVITNNSFVMPAENVVVTCEFIVDAPALTVEDTNLEFVVSNSNLDATAHIETTFEDNGVVVKFVVEDSKIVLRDNSINKSDGIQLYLSKNSDSEGYLENSTYLVEALVNGTSSVSVYDGSKFVASNSSNVTCDVELFASGSNLGGYSVEVAVPYALWDLTKESAKGELIMCPVLYNSNSDSKLISSTAGYPEDYHVDPENHNTFIVLMDDNTYEENINLYPGYYFKNSSSIPNGEYWDITKDTEASSGEVKLTNHDRLDNHLLFNVSSSEFMYAKTTIKLTDYYLVGDQYLKFGIVLFDGDSNNGVFYYIDAAAVNTDANEIADINGNKFGVNLMDAGYTKWNEVDSDYVFNLETKTVTVELVYSNGNLYFFADGNLVSASCYQAETNDLHIGLKNFGFGCTLTDYYCTDNKDDSAISSTLAKISASAKVDNYGAEVETSVIDNNDVVVKYSAIDKAEGAYIQALITTPVLPKQQSADNGWWNWTNFEFLLNDRQLYVAVQANMHALNDQYHVLFSRAVKNADVSITQNADGNYEMLFNIFVGEIAKNSVIRLNYFVIDGVRNGPQSNTTYVISSKGLILPSEVEYDINISSSIENGTVTADLRVAKAGTVVTLSSTPAEGYRLSAYYVNGQVIEGNTFEMLSGNVTVTAEFILLSKYSVNLIVTGTNGEISVNTTSAVAGEEIILTVDVERGYKVVDLLVNGTAIDGYSFLMPEEDVVISASIVNDEESGYVFVNKNDLAIGTGYNIDADTASEDGVVKLVSHDLNDNRIFFNVSSKEFMYAKATITLTDYLLVGDQYLKFGIALFEEGSKGVYYYIDATASGTDANELADIHGTGFGTNYRLNNSYLNWAGLDTVHGFNLETKSVTLELVYDNGKLYLFADGNLINAAYYKVSSNNPYIGLFNYGLGADITNYYCTSNEDDINIADTLAKINVNEVTDYGQEVSTTVGSTVGVKYSAVSKEEGNYVSATLIVNNLPKKQGNDNGWWNWTNFEFNYAGAQLYIAVAASMDSINDSYHVFGNKLVSDIKVSIIKNAEEKYEITFNFLIAGGKEYDAINLNYFVVDGEKSGPADRSTYLITSSGLINPADRLFDIEVSQEVENGTVEVDVESAKEGTTVTLSSTPAEGYVLLAYTVNGNTIEGNTFVMPAGNVVVGATFVEEGSIITVEGVEITGAEAGEVKEGTSVNLSATVTANVEGLLVNWSSSNEAVATVDENGVVTFKLVDADAEVTITATSKNDETKFDSVTFTVKRQIRLDGSKNDVIWTEAVLANGYVFNKPDSEVLMTIYATRTADGVYFFINYQVLEPHTEGAWWQRDNAELRLISPNGRISNGENFQWFVSTNNESKFDLFSITEAVKNDETNYFEISFELFVSYSKLGINENTPLGISFGSNPGGDGWYCSADFESDDISKHYKVTVDGITRHCNPETCEHVYGEYVIVNNATCSENGSKEAYCKYCNHKDVQVIESTGEHVYDYSNVKVITESTICSEYGVGEVACGCGAKKNIDLEPNYMNHGDNWDEETHVCACGSLIQPRHESLSGWNTNMVSLTMDGTKSWEIDVLLNAKHNEHSREWAHLFDAEVFSPGWANGGWTFRSDWWGWGTWHDNGNVKYTDINNGTWQDKYFEASNDMDVRMNIKFDAEAKTITVTMTYTSNVDPYSAEVKHLTYVCSNITYSGDMIVGLGGDSAELTYYYVKVLNGTGTLN